MSKKQKQCARANTSLMPFILIIMAFGLFVSVRSAQAADYNITSCAELMSIDDEDGEFNDPDGTYILQNDIDCAAELITEFEPIDFDFDYNTGTGGFTGVFDGNDKTISNLNINKPDMIPVALFTGITGGAVVQDLTLDSVSVVGHSWTAVLVGVAVNSTVSNVSAEGSVSGMQAVAGLIGTMYAMSGQSSITESSFVGTVTGVAAIAGGLVGSLAAVPDGTAVTRENSIVISKSYTDVDLTADQFVGGLIGTGTIIGDVGGNYYILIEDTYATGDVTDTTWGVAGGLIGQTNAQIEITRSYAASDVFATNTTATQSHGGLIGKTGTAQGGGASEVYISNSFAAGTVQPTQDDINLIGGFIGKSPASENPPGIHLSGNHFYKPDETVVCTLTGTEERVFESGCDPVAEQSVFFGESVETTFPDWNFTDVWQSHEDGYPTLLAFSTSEAPTVSTGAASDITQTGATLNGTIDTAGSPDPSQRGFEYGLSALYGSTVSTDGSFTAGAFTETVSDLACGTTYHYRAFATNTAGTANGNDATLTTTACPSTSGSVIRPPEPRLGAHPNGTLILDGPTVYLIRDGRRHGFRDEQEYASHGYSFSQTVPANAADRGLQYGGIIKAMDGALVLDSSDGRTVYIIGEGGVKRGFVSQEVFTGLGYGFSGLLSIDLSDYPTGADIENAAEAHPEGALVREDNGTVWWIRNGKKSGFVSEEVFRTYGFRFGQVVPANAADLDLEEASPVIFRDGTLVLDAGNRFIISDGKKRQFQGDSFSTLGYRESNLVTAGLALYNYGPDIR